MPASRKSRSYSLQAILSAVRPLECPRVSPGDQPLTKKPADSGIEIGVAVLKSGDVTNTRLRADNETGERRLAAYTAFIIPDSDH